MKRRYWGRQARQLAVRGLVVLLFSLAVGAGYSCVRSPQYLPAFSGNVYAMLPMRDTLFMVLSQNANNSLVHLDNQGKLLNYVTTSANQAFQELEILDQTVYAILATCQDGETAQSLVSLSLDQTPMRIRRLADLSHLPEAPEADITWTGVYLPLDEEAPEELRLAGIGAGGQGYLLYWSLETGDVRLERVLEGEELYRLKYVDDGHWVWVNRDKQAGQLIDGVWQRDILAGLAQTPNHISTCGRRCFLSDSVSGDIYELLPDGSAQLCRQGDGYIGATGLRFRQIEIFTTYPNAAGEIQIVGLCACDNGASSIVAGEDRVIERLDMGLHRTRLILRKAWEAALVGWPILMAAVEVIRAVLYSPRLVVRLALCELMMAGVLLGAVTWVQLRSFQAEVQEAAQQKLALAGGNLSVLLATPEPMGYAETAQAVRELRRRVMGATAGSGDYAIDVVWASEYGPKIGYDDGIPPGYLVEDVKSRGYYALVTGALERGSSSLQPIQNDVDTEYIYVQPFEQAGQAGCVTVSQTEADILSGRTTFWASMIPVFAACPLLFLLLIAITWYLLRPMGVIQAALREFYECGGGNQMDLSRIPKTELYQVGQVFNELSIQTRVQLNTLSTINSSYVRLVPDCLLQMLGKKDVLELSAGEYAAVDGGLLMLVPERAARTAARMSSLAGPAMEQIQRHRGMVIDYDEGLGAFTAVFGDAEQARACARQCVSAYDGLGQRVMAAVFTEAVEIGVFGSERLLYPVAVSAALHRRQEVLSVLNSFGAVLVYSGVPGDGALRLLGWDNGLAYYEDPACRPGGWQAQWKEAAPLWDRAVRQFQAGGFAQAMRIFARVLRLMPGDNAARWYLFRCESLRDKRTGTPDTGLLFDWRARHG